jgi:nitroreductase
MRRLKPDPIPEDVQARILDAAIRAPSAGHSQNWRFLLVDDRSVRAELGEVYRECLGGAWTGVYAARVAAAEAEPDAEESHQFLGNMSSAIYLAEHFGDAPLLLFAFAHRDRSGMSIFPAVWSAMLAARAEGIGSALTTALDVQRDRTLEILGVPRDEGWIMACCVPFGYPLGRWGIAKRQPAHDVSYRNRWGDPLGFEVPEPLWAQG